ncbi:MAG: lysophospholipase L1-like esterase [Zhongshania sp.]|jgi:lysophospholipase L1-like esterase
MQQQFEDAQARQEALYAELAVEATDTIMLGDSLTDGAPWAELIPDRVVKNRGIGGQTSEDIQKRLYPITKGHPRQVFFMAGSNDLAQGKSIREITSSIEYIVNQFGQLSPQTQLLIQSVLPREPKLSKKITQLNEHLLNISKKNGLYFIDLYSAFTSKQGSIKSTLSNDNIHLMPEGYRLWLSLIKPYLRPYFMPDTKLDPKKLMSKPLNKQ